MNKRSGRVETVVSVPWELAGKEIQPENGVPFLSGATRRLFHNRPSSSFFAGEKMQTPNADADRARDQVADDDGIDSFREAAWYALVPFLNPIDCARRCEITTGKGKKPYAAAIPLNFNDTLNAFFNGDPVSGKQHGMTWFSKKRLANHLSQRETYYYRSRPNGTWREGYGSYPTAMDRLGQAAPLLGIEGKCRRYNWVGVMLLCADIDCHNGEKDVAAVRDWLLAEYFPGAYWEPSTGGEGVHLYIKLQYRPWLLKDRDATLRHVVNTINHVALLLDTQRKALGYDAPVDKLRGLPSLFAEKNNRIQILRSSCIKIPRFANGPRDVRSFHFAPFFLFDYFERMSLDGMKATAAAEPPAQGIASLALGWEIERNSSYEPPYKGGGAVALNSVYPSYTDCLDDLRQQQDAFTRTLGFALAYSRHIRRVPSIEEAVAEYEAQGLATGLDVTGARHSRMEYVLGYVAKTFKPSKDCTSGFQTAQEELIAEIRSLMRSDLDLTYAKARGRRVRVSDTDLAALLHAIRKSQGAGDNTEFSQKQVSRSIKSITGRSCNKNMASCLTKALLAMNLVERVGGYIQGRRGFVYAVKSLVADRA